MGTQGRHVCKIKAERVGLKPATTTMNIDKTSKILGKSARFTPRSLASLDFQRVMVGGKIAILSE